MSMTIEQRAAFAALQKLTEAAMIRGGAESRVADLIDEAVSLISQIVQSDPGTVPIPTEAGGDDDLDEVAEPSIPAGQPGTKPFRPAPARCAVLRHTYNGLGGPIRLPEHDVRVGYATYFSARVAENGKEFAQAKIAERIEQGGGYPIILNGRVEGRSLDAEELEHHEKMLSAFTTEQRQNLAWYRLGTYDLRANLGGVPQAVARGYHNVGSTSGKPYTTEAQSKHVARMLNLCRENGHEIVHLFVCPDLRGSLKITEQRFSEGDGEFSFERQGEWLRDLLQREDLSWWRPSIIVWGVWSRLFSASEARDRLAQFCSMICDAAEDAGCPVESDD